MDDSELRSILLNLSAEDSAERYDANDQLRRRYRSPSSGWYEAAISDNPRLRAGAASAAGNFAEVDARVAELLASLIEDADEGVRHTACCTAGELGPRAIGVLPNILSAIHDPVGFVRYAAVEASAQIGPSEPGVWAAILRACTDSVWNVRSVAIESYAKCVRGSTLQIVRPAIADQEWHVRLTGLKTLLRSAGQDVLAELRADIEQCLSDPDYAVRCAATRLARRFKSSLSDEAKLAIARNSDTSDEELSRLSDKLLRDL